VGKFGPDGSVSYRGMLHYRTASQKLARLNNACGVFEYDVDPAGNTTSKVWSGGSGQETQTPTHLRLA